MQQHGGLINYIRSFVCFV